MSKLKVRSVGNVLLDLEKVIDELVDGHDLQWGDVLNLVHGHLQVHNPAAREEYVEGGHPEFYYGPGGQIWVK